MSKHKYLCSYAYDVPHYADFTVEANNRREALKIIRAALSAGRFSLVCGETYDDDHSYRVFVQHRHNEKYDTDVTMEQLIEESEQ